MSIIPSFQLICTAAQLIWTHHWIEKLPNLTFHLLNSWCVSQLCQIYLHFCKFVQLYSWFELTTVMALKDYPNLTFHMLNSLVCISIYVNFTIMSADLYSCTAGLNSPLDLPWKTTPIWPLICETPWCVSQFYLYVSWFVQLISWFDIITGLALKNYPNLTFNMWNSLVCISISSSCQLICTADQLIWHHHWICLEKLPQFDS